MRQETKEKIGSKNSIKMKEKWKDLKFRERMLETFNKSEKVEKVLMNGRKKAHTPKAIEKMRKTKILQYSNSSNHPRWKGGLTNPNCKDCGKKISWNAKRCRKCHDLWAIGINCPNWKFGNTNLVMRIRHCFQYRQWQSDIFTRDNFTCVLCGIRGGYLEADHYPKMFSIIFHENKIKTYEEALNCEEFWNINNGRTLCKKCHRLETNLKNNET